MPRHDDVDDFMASILGGQSEPPKNAKPSVFAKKPAPVQPVRTQPSLRVQQESKPKAKPRRNFRKLTRLLTALVLLAVASVGIYWLWRGPISSLLEPKSPFSAKIQENMGIPLYFPTKLPGSFMIETDSITQPEGDVVLYAITDNDNKRINITLQKRPTGISLDPLYAALSDLKDIETKQFGKVKTGVSAEGAQITNILAEKTWILINYPKGTINDTQLTELLDSLKQ